MTELFAGYICWCFCHGGRCYEHPIVDDVDNVSGMVVDVMTTQYVCTMWHILKLIMVDIITTQHHVFYMSCWHIPFPDWKKLFNHCEIAHPWIECKICNSFFISKELLEKHMTRYDNSKLVINIYINYMNGSFLYCFISCNWAMFIQNTIIILLWDKLLPHSYHSFILSAAHIFLNYVCTEDAVWVLLWSVFFIWNMTSLVHFMADV